MSPYALSEAEREAIAPHGVPRTYPKGAVVVSEGDNTDSLYVILEGRVKIYASDQDGHEVVFGTQGPGEYFGEMVLDEGPRSASVITLEKSRFLMVPKAQLRLLIAENPEFALNMMKKLITRVRALTASVKSLPRPGPRVTRGSMPQSPRPYRRRSGIPSPMVLRSR